jgi:hypothetical protein
VKDNAGNVNVSFELLSMNSTRLPAGMLFVVLALKVCALAVAQDVDQSWEPSIGQSNPPKNHVFVLDAREEKAGRVQSNDRIQPALSEDVPFGDPMTFASDELRPTAPILEPQYDDCDSYCCPTCNNPCPCFYGQVEALFLLRSPRFIRQPIVVDPNTDTTFLSTSDLASMFNPGIRATFGMRLCGGRALEFSYFGLFQGNASAVVVRPDPDAFLIFPDNLFGNVFVDMDRVLVNYGSALNGFEANLPCCCGCCDDDCCCGDSDYGDVRCRSFEWFAGFRYLNLNENLIIDAERDVAGGIEEGSYRIRTNNNLYGAQLGARVRRTRGRFGWEATGKGGVFANDSQQTQSVTDFPDFAIRPTVSSRGSRVAFIGELNLSGLYRLSDVWNLRAGYSAIWIEGVALAPDQLDFNFAASPSGNTLHNGGGLLLHGVNVGVEARW